MSTDKHETAVFVFAHFLGIDIEKEHHLLYIARDALSPKGLPKGWELGFGDGENDGIPFFFNTETEESVWNHPKEAVFVRKVKEEKEKDARRKANEAQNKKKGNNTTNTTTANNKSSGGASSASGGATERQSQGTKANVVAKEDPGMEVLEFEEPFGFSPDPKGAGAGGSAAERERERDREAGKTGVVTANESKPAVSLQATDFFASDAVDEHPVKAPVITATTTTTVTNSRTGGTISAASSSSSGSGPGPKKATKTASASDVWANGGSSDAPQSPGSVARITGPPLSSREREREKEKDKWAADEKERERDRDSKNKERLSAASEDSSRVGRNAASDREREREREREAAREKERDMREKEAREAREREEIRKREKERENRERERERERERGTAVNGRELEAELAVERRRTDAERRRGDMLDSESNALREKQKRLEEQLEDERKERREAEERLYRVQGDTDERLRDVTEKWEERVREASRAGRQEVEQEWRERLKSTDRRTEEDTQILREEIRAGKARTEDALKEMDILRRRVSQSHDDGKMEAQLELEKLRNEVETLEAKARAQGLELRRLREDHVDVGSRLAVALQSAQIAQAESEAAKSQASSIVAEGKSSHTALVQATNRIQSLDSECAKLKAENLLHRREIDTQQAELRKLQAAAGMTVENINAQESTHRRARAQAESEVARLTSKLSEQGAVLEVLRAQLDKAQDSQSHSIRDVEKQLDRSIFDVHRLQEALREQESKASVNSTRILELEKLLIVAQDGTFRAERALREEQQRQQLSSQRLEQQRATAEAELASAREETHQSRLAISALEAKHRGEMEALKREVAERIPKISQAVVERLENQFQSRVDSELGAQQSRSDLAMQSLKRELLDLQVHHAERDARQRAAVADERAELERLKGHNERQHRQIAALETELDDALTAVRRNGGRALLLDAARASSSAEEKIDHATVAANSSYILNNSTTAAAATAESFTAVSQLQGQLTWMKQQLNLALDSTTDKKMHRALGEQAPFASPAFARFRPQPHVTFSPESLFQSPNPISSNKSRTASASASASASAAGSSSLGTRRLDTGKSGGSTGQQQQQQQRSVFDHIRFRDDVEDGALPYASGGNESAINRSQANYETGANYDYMDDITTARSKGAGTGKSSGGAGTFKQGSLLSAADDDESFEGIQDGGYHEGYWKARYSKMR